MYVVRDRDGSLWIHTEKPYKKIFCWMSRGECESIYSNFFPEVKWEDNEPRELVLKPIKEEQP